MVAERGPVEVGVNVTFTVQLPPAATGLAQVSVSAKSSPMAISLTTIAIVPVFVTVTDCISLWVWTGCAAKVSAVGATIAVVAGAVAVINGICQMPRP